MPRSRRATNCAPGQVLLSGAVGGMVPAEPGDYVADYGALGTLRFTVR